MRPGKCDRDNFRNLDPEHYDCGTDKLTHIAGYMVSKQGSPNQGKGSQSSALEMEVTSNISKSGLLDLNSLNRKSLVISSIVAKTKRISPKSLQRVVHIALLNCAICDSMVGVSAHEKNIWPPPPFLPPRRHPPSPIARLPVPIAFLLLLVPIALLLLVPIALLLLLLRTCVEICLFVFLAFLLFSLPKKKASQGGTNHEVHIVN